MLKKILLALSLASCASAALEIEENQIDKGKVFAQGKQVTLLGQGVTTEQQAPSFKVVDSQFKPITLQDFAGKAVLISVVPSLDTGVCSLQTKFFNQEVADKFPNVEMLTISADLPFAQKRFCAVEGIDKIKTLSDSVWRDFGQKYGLYIKDMGLLSRAIFVLDKEHKITYKQLVSNLATEPNYEEAIAHLNAISSEKTEVE
ncbi:MAG: lipid hydroperoxide peroxidase [Pseudoalteromonas sp.]|uniref:thiol peroxidase n=1 Tax=Pseudoalteromonas phenolica TaxID=161398 RepID=UPI000C0BB294|nr:lipid hydroperoxide peroxidase [Pseudoalteromonas sp.]|tara:strand:+ start:227 stop:832 length:606 start_codon:yes stop_codon:yes gene_type:complete